MRLWSDAREICAIKDITYCSHYIIICKKLPYKKKITSNNLNNRTPGGFDRRMVVSVDFYSYSLKPPGFKISRVIVLVADFWKKRFELFLGKGTFIRSIFCAVKMCQVDKTYAMIREIFPLEGMNLRKLLKIRLPAGIVAFHLGWKVFWSWYGLRVAFFFWGRQLYTSCRHPFYIFCQSFLRLRRRFLTMRCPMANEPVKSIKIFWLIQKLYRVPTFRPIVFIRFSNGRSATVFPCLKAAWYRQHPFACCKMFLILKIPVGLLRITRG